MSRRNHFITKDIQIIQDFIMDIDEDVKVCRSSSFSVDCDEEIIFLGNKRYDRVSKIFMNWVNKKFNTNIHNWIAISILHEMGHIMTNTEEMREQRAKLDSIYTFLYEQGIIETEYEYFTKYFEIEAEIAATTWAVHYYLTHKEKCDTMVELIGSTDF